IASSTMTQALAVRPRAELLREVHTPALLASQRSADKRANVPAQHTRPAKTGRRHSEAPTAPDRWHTTSSRGDAATGIR
ncbi:MAG: hypothetical protein ACOVRM_13325, partial [Planctomycetaceae bacterium]